MGAHIYYQFQYPKENPLQLKILHVETAFKKLQILWDYKITGNDLLIFKKNTVY